MEDDGDWCHMCVCTVLSLQPTSDKHPNALHCNDVNADDDYGDDLQSLHIISVLPILINTGLHNLFQVGNGGNG